MPSEACTPTILTSDTEVSKWHMTSVRNQARSPTCLGGDARDEGCDQAQVGGGWGMGGLRRL